MKTFGRFLLSFLLACNLGYTTFFKLTDVVKGASAWSSELNTYASEFNTIIQNSKFSGLRDKLDAADFLTIFAPSNAALTAYMDLPETANTTSELIDDLIEHDLELFFSLEDFEVSSVMSNGERTRLPTLRTIGQLDNPPPFHLFISRQTGEDAKIQYYTPNDVAAIEDTPSVEDEDVRIYLIDSFFQMLSIEDVLDQSGLSQSPFFPVLIKSTIDEDNLHGTFFIPVQEEQTAFENEVNDIIGAGSDFSEFVNSFTRRHVVASNDEDFLFSEDLQNLAGSNVQTRGGDSLPIASSGSSTRVSTAIIEYNDIVFERGVIHTVDRRIPAPTLSPTTSPTTTNSGNRLTSTSFHMISSLLLVVSLWVIF